MRIKVDKKLIIGASAVTAALLLALILPIFTAQAAASPVRMTIHAAYDDASQVVRVSQEIHYRHTGTGSLSSLYFHAYPLAYSSEESAPFFERDMKLAYPNGFSPGGIEIKSLRLDRKEAPYELLGYALEIPLNAPVGTGKTVRVNVEYDILIPDCRDRFGYSDTAVNLCNAFLIPAVFDQEGWHVLEEYPPIGDPFYSDVSDYKMTLSAPEGYTLASTGVIKSEKTKDGAVTYQIEAPGVRDFAAVLSARYVTAETSVDGIRVLSHAATLEDAERVLEYAAEAVGCFGERFGKCVYPEVEICATGFFTGGMEYPGLALIDVSAYAMEEADFLEFCVKHEVAHQWFYGAVGSDQINEPWVDESLAEYATLICYEDWDGTAGFQRAYEDFIKPYLYVRNLEKTPINQSIYDYKNVYEYTAVVYAKGAAMWHALRKEIGDEAFFAALKDYYLKYAGSIATGENLLSCFGGEAAGYLRGWLDGTLP